MSRRGRAIAGTVVGLVVVAVGVAAALAWGASRAPGPASSAPSSAPSSSSSSSAGPPTPDPVQTSSAPPSAQPTPSPSVSTPPAPGAVTVGVVLVYAGWNSTRKQIDFSGFTSAVVESGGTCTASATGANGTVTAKVGALASATSTECLPLSIPGSALAPGRYTVKLSYSSPTARGISQSAKVVVP